MIERLAMGPGEPYSPLESAIHLGRYSLVRGLCEGRRVLDFACGEGYGSAVMASVWGAKAVVGVDLSTDAISSARANFRFDNLRFEVGADTELETLLAGGEFDLIVSLETIEHLHSPRDYLEALKRLAAPGASIVISCPNDHAYYSEAESNPFHVRKYHLEEFLELTESVLGPVDTLMFGFPAKGFVNLPMGNGAELPRAGGSALDIIERGPEAETVNVPSAAPVTPQGSAYFVGYWGHTATAEEPGSGALFAEPMDVPTPEQLALTQALTEVDRLNRALELVQTELRTSVLQIEARRVEQEALQENLFLTRLALTEREAELSRAEAALEAALGRRVKRRLQKMGIRRSTLRSVSETLSGFGRSDGH